jgi:hypothetical protein
LQFNRGLVRAAANKLFLDDPKQNPDLAAALKEMGLSCEEKILHYQHPIVTAASAAMPGQTFILAPPKVGTMSSVLAAKGQIFDQFRTMLGKVFIALPV